jgi:hypothetical protein
MQAPVPSALLFAVVVLTAPASAAPPDRSQVPGQAGGSSSAAQAAEQVRRQTGGRILSVQERDGGYEVKVLTPSGEVRSVYISAGR